MFLHLYLNKLLYWAYWRLRVWRWLQHSHGEQPSTSQSLSEVRRASVQDWRQGPRLIQEIEKITTLKITGSRYQKRVTNMERTKSGMNTEVFNVFRYVKINKHRSEFSMFTHSKIPSLVLSIY